MYRRRIERGWRRGDEGPTGQAQRRRALPPQEAYGRRVSPL